MSDRSAHICVACGGQFTVGLASPGEALIDFIFVQPGEWGRFEGLSVQAESVAWLKQMGVTMIRQGGSFADGSYYSWQ